MRAPHPSPKVKTSARQQTPQPNSGRTPQVPRLFTPDRSRSHSTSTDNTHLHTTSSATRTTQPGGVVFSRKATRRETVDIQYNVLRWVGYPGRTKWIRK